MDALETAREGLELQLEPIEREYALLSEKMDVLKQARDQLKAAIAELKPAKQRKPKSSGKASKPSPTKADVIATCRRLVEANAPIAEADLVSLVKHTLKEEEGFSLSGAPRLLQNYLASDAVVISPNGDVSLATASTSEGGISNVVAAGKSAVD